MSRKEKIKLLQAIREGKVTREVLHQRVYVFLPDSHQPGYFRLNGELISPERYRELIAEINRNNENIRTLGLCEKTFGQSEITLVYKAGATIL